jgi:hypothetical protein
MCREHEHRSSKEGDFSSPTQPHRTNAPEREDNAPNMTTPPNMSHRDARPLGEESEDEHLTLHSSPSCYSGLQSEDDGTDSSTQSDCSVLILGSPVNPIGLPGSEDSESESDSEPEWLKC